LQSASSNIDIGNVGGFNDNNTIRIGMANIQTQTFIAGIAGTTVANSGVAVYVDPLTGQLGTISPLGGNTANGYQALYQPLSHGAGSQNPDNTAIGYQALWNLGPGSDNIALGYQAGFNLQSASSNIDIGNVGGFNDNNTIRIGMANIQTQTFIAGIYGATAASGVAVYVNSSGQLGTLSSSRRYKQEIQGMDQASDVLYSLQPVTFKYKPGIDPQGIPQFGLVAEDVEKVAPDLVAHDEQGKIYTVRYQAVDAMLLNEFLKEHRKVETQDTEIQNLEKKLNELQAVVKQLAAQK
jgi:hypothetical protein